MKRLFILTSLLALAACGGGSGGGAGQTNGAEDFMRSGFVTDAAKDSNSKVTSMTSAIVVAKDGSGSAVRSSTKIYNGKEYAVYTLEDVKLHLADIAAEDGYLKIGVDGNGRIDKMTMVMGEDDSGNPIGGGLARLSDSNARFNGPIFEYVQDRYAKDSGSVFSIGTGGSDFAAMRGAIATKRNYSGGDWHLDGDKWQYKDGGNNILCSIGNNIEAMQQELVNAYGFKNEGRWVNENGTYKYIEYGDKALYRVAATDSVTKANLDDIVTRKQLNKDGSVGHWNRVNEVMDVVSLGKDIDGKGTSLQYADFGHFNPVYKDKLVDLESNNGNTWQAAKTKTHSDAEVEDELAAEDYQLFAGGYAIDGTTQKDTLDVPVNTTFKGKAIGRVYVSFQSNGVENRDTYLANWNVPKDNGNSYSEKAGHDIAKTFTTTNATMIVDANGKQTLNMPFDGFYNVKVEKAGKNPVKYEFIDSKNALANSQYRVNNNPGETEGAFRPGYYGVNTASEAAGTVYYATEQGIGTGADAGKISREWEFQAAYGMKKQ